MASGEILQSFPKSAESQARYAFSELGALIVHTSRGGGYLYDAVDGSKLRTYGEVEEAHGGFQLDADFIGNFHSSRDGRWVVSSIVAPLVADDSEVITVWDIVEGKELRRFVPPRDFDRKQSLREVGSEFTPLFLVERSGSNYPIYWIDIVHCHGVTGETTKLGSWRDRYDMPSLCVTTPDGEVVLRDHKKHPKKISVCLPHGSPNSFSLPLPKHGRICDGLDVRPAGSVVPEPANARPRFSPNGEWGVLACSPHGRWLGEDSHAVLVCRPFRSTNTAKVACREPLTISGDGSLLAGSTPDGVAIWEIKVQ
jgi:hypothetical protein